MHYLAGTDSVHTTAAICDYLVDRASPDDTVTAIAAVPSDDPTARRDGEEALTVAPVRLATVGDVVTDIRTGSPAETLHEEAAASDVDEIVIGTHSGAPDATRELGSTAQRVLTDADYPVVVVPIPDL